MTGPIRLQGALKHYAWGSRTALAALAGRPTPSERPEAELWYGSHERAATQASSADGLAENLRDLLHERGEAELPFLVKLLAAAEPLSLQLHPSAARAAEGFAREEAAGVPRDDPRRLFPDPHAKPEVICALSELHALSGLRPGAEAAAELRRHELPLPRPLLRQLAGEDPDAGAGGGAPGGDPRPLLRHLLTLAGSARRELGDAVGRIAAAPRAAADHWVARLAERYPGDPAALAPLLLNLVELRPGEALYSGAGVLHSYLEGVGVEVMGPSDNVLRGGLTPKAIDVPEVLAALDPRPAPPAVIRPSEPGPDGAADYPLPGAPFGLSAWQGQVSAAVPADPAESSPRPLLLLATEGRFRVAAGGESVEIGATEAVLLTGSSLPAAIEGRGRLFRVRG